MNKQFKLKNIDNKPKNPKASKKWLFFMIAGIVGILGGTGLILFSILSQGGEIVGPIFPKIPLSLNPLFNLPSVSSSLKVLPIIFLVYLWFYNLLNHNN